MTTMTKADIETADNRRVGLRSSSRLRLAIAVLVIIVMSSFNLMPSIAVAQTPTTQQDALDKTALVALYNATNGPNWLNNDYWLSDRPIAEWHGVTTDVTGRVVELDLSSNGLLGLLPSELADLENLKRLRLSDNQLYGNVPSALGTLENLVSLDLSSNDLMGYLPRELGQLSDLDDIALADNGLLGCIPEGLRIVTDNDFNRMLLPFCGDEDDAFSRALDEIRTQLEAQQALTPTPETTETVPVQTPTSMAAITTASTPVPGTVLASAPTPAPAVHRGFFTNSVSSPGSVEAELPFDIMDPVTLTLIGVLVTLGATAIQLFRGR